MMCVRFEEPIPTIRSLNVTFTPNGDVIHLLHLGDVSFTCSPRSVPRSCLNVRTLAANPGSPFVGSPVV